MHHQKLFALVATLFLFQACKTKQPVRPDEYYDTGSVESLTSTISLPINISKFELEKNINQQLGDVLYEDNDMRGDGLKIKATKNDDIKIEVEGQQVKYLIPVDLKVAKDLAITIVEGEGALAVEMVTAFNISPDWDFSTSTQITNYKWTKTPLIRTALGNLNVTGIADEFIGQFKNEITSTIDQELKSMFDLKKEVERAWKEMQQPFLISDEQPSYLLFSPQSIGMTPLTTRDGAIQSTVVVSAQPKLLFGEEPWNEQATQLPDFQMLESTEKDNFEVKMSSSIPFSEAQKIAKENMMGETFEFGGKKVKVEDVELYGQGSRLVVKTNLSGDYQGDVYLIGKPAYNNRKNKIELENVEFDFSSKKVLMKTASWLFKGPFKRRIQDELDFHLSENLEGTKELIQQELKEYELASGIQLRGNLNDLSISNIYINTNGINVQVGLDGQLNLEINGL